MGHSQLSAKKQLNHMNRLDAVAFYYPHDLGAQRSRPCAKHTGMKSLVWATPALARKRNR